MRDALVFIGRFQPFHNGHKAVIEAALEQAKEVVVVVGSSFAARNLRNPFTFEERKAMIEACFTEPKYFNYYGAQGRVKLPRVRVVPVSDFPYDDNKWVNAIQKIVDETIPDAKDVGLIGHSKDSTSYYLNIFPRWKNHVEVEDVSGINATDIRNSIFGTHLNKEFVELGLVRFALDTALDEKLPAETVKVLKKIVYSGKLDHDSAESGLYINEKTAPFKVLQSEYEMVKKYKEAWKAAPFPPTFMTVDAVVVQSGHILLVKRGDMPGKGLWALPGGFLEQGETMLNGAIRELKEETKIKVPVPVLIGSIKESKTFDAPNRSSRGRTITQAFFIDLGVGELPKVKGSDDAEKAFWVPFNQVKQEKMFEDHFFIIDNFLNIG
jgi:bifunctional NMN adenylyltransferase/nudix hydrolase